MNTIHHMPSFMLLLSDTTAKPVYPIPTNSFSIHIVSRSFLLVISWISTKKKFSLWLFVQHIKFHTWRIGPLGIFYNCTHQYLINATRHVMNRTSITVYWAVYVSFKMMFPKKVYAKEHVTTALVKLMFLKETFHYYPDVGATFYWKIPCDILFPRS